ncbi:MAG: iron-siderophore ABC transporter substrate-binding protein [Alteromonadaceae bacterium]|nr:iron-siderophore ABC transporter substrate-binding protein [Alteromonadaceae bacterium]
MFTKLGPVIALVLAMVSLAAPATAETWHHENGTLTLDQPPTRIITLNWAATEAALLLGVTPVGVADLQGYHHWVRQPTLPEEGVANVGTRVAPSLEAIAELKPDLIVTSAEMAPAANLLERIAPTYVISVYRPETHSFEQARKMLLTLGEMLDRRERAESVLTDIEQTLEYERARLEEADLQGRPVALVNFLDARHVRVHAPNGLYQTALDALGLDNAWPHDGNFWGFSVVGLEALANYKDARLVAISPTPPGLRETLADSPFWTYLPAAQRRQVYQIDPVWPFGGTYQVKRLASYLTDALLAGGSDNVE